MNWLSYFEVLEHSCPRMLSFLIMYMLFPVRFVANSLETRHRSSCSCEQMFWLERESSWKRYLLTYKMNRSFHMGLLPNLKLRLALFPLREFSLCKRKSTHFIIWAEVLATVLNINLTYSSTETFHTPVQNNITKNFSKIFILKYC